VKPFAGLYAELYNSLFAQYYKIFLGMPPAPTFKTELFLIPKKHPVVMFVTHLQGHRFFGLLLKRHRFLYLFLNTLLFPSLSPLSLPLEYIHGSFLMANIAHVLAHPLSQEQMEA
jgi:hypothetical protein